MIGSRKLIDIHKHHLIANNIMAHEVDIIDHYIVADIRTDDGAVV
jgi:hypothetical protein